MLVADRVMSRAKIHSVHPMASPSHRQRDRYKQNPRQLLPVEPEEFCRRGCGGLAAFRCRSRGTVGLRFRGLSGLSFHQLVQCDAEHCRELYQLIQIRDAPVRLPFTDGLPGDPQLFRQSVLGKSSLGSQLCQALPQCHIDRLRSHFLMS